MFLLYCCFLVCLGFWLGFFFCSLRVPRRKNHLSLWGQIPRLDLGKILSVSFCLNKGVRVLPRSRKGQKLILRFTLKQAEPAVPAHGAEWCQAMLDSAETLPSAKEGSVPAKSRTSLQRASRGSFEERPDSAMGSRHPVRQAGWLWQGCHEGGCWQSWWCGAQISPRVEVSGGHLHPMAG